MTYQIKNSFQSGNLKFCNSEYLQAYLKTTRTHMKLLILYFKNKYD
jgi:hypothetical protein